VFNVAAYGRLDVNVALNRPSYLISTYVDGTLGAYSASKANDGDKTNCDGYLAGFSIAASEYYELNPWYVVDLLVALQVSIVKVTSVAYYGK